MFGFGTKFFRNRWLPLPHASVSNSASDSRRRAASFRSSSLARTPRADGTRPHVRLWIKKSAARPAGSRSAHRRDPTRRRALTPRRRALPPPPSGPAAATLRGLRLELLADGRLQHVRFRRLRTPTRGICRRVTGVSVRRPAAFRPADSRISFCTSPGLSTTASGSPLTCFTLNVNL